MANQPNPYDHAHRGQRKRLLAMAYGEPCPLCGQLMLDQPLDIDHIVPVWLGGDDGIQNKRATCASCNRSKGAAEGNRLRRRRASRDW